MIETILSKAGQAILNKVSSVSRSGGEAVILSVKDGGITRKIPACLPLDADPLNPAAEYMYMLPDDKESAIAFWQVLSAEPTGTGRHHVQMRARCRLVIWANLKRLQPANAMLVAMACKSVVQSADLTEPWVQSVLPTMESVEFQNKGIFSEYAFDETQTQYLTFPYAFASTLWEFQYRILTNCLPAIGPIQSSC